MAYQDIIDAFSPTSAGAAEPDRVLGPSTIQQLMKPLRPAAKVVVPVKPQPTEVAPSSPMQQLARQFQQASTPKQAPTEQPSVDPDTQDIITATQAAKA